ncbi:hypothetical protein RhiJN_06886 [Ceratobasidium sp. AG-Ba]|nr:hypothetical protein RhiJN_06886 [Ceratobasidium sp. AG-Ba]
MVDGQAKPKPRTAACFRDLPERAKLSLPNPEAAAKGGNLADNPDIWLDEEPTQLNPDICAEYNMEELTGHLSALRIINLQSPALADMLSTTPVDLPTPESTNAAGPSTQDKGKQKECIRTADEVAWD